MDMYKNIKKIDKFVLGKDNCHKIKVFSVKIRKIGFSFAMYPYIPLPVLVEAGELKFVIAGSPRKFALNDYVEELLRHRTKKLVKVSETAYNTAFLSEVGISVRELIIPDGSFPSDDVIEEWLNIVVQHFSNNPNSALAVHDNSGLGRAPVFVAIALIENGAQAPEVVRLLRSKRRGCFNDHQYDKLMNYQPKLHLKKLSKHDNHPKPSTSSSVPH